MESNNNIIHLEEETHLNTKGELWKPNKKARASLEQHGYKFKDTIATCEFSKTKVAHLQKENIDVAVKIIKKNKLQMEVLKKFVPQEIAILQQIQHPGIVSINTKARQHYKLNTSF